MSKLPISHWFVTTCLVSLAGAAWAISPSEKQQLDNFKVSTLKGLRGVTVSVKIVRDKPETLSLLKESELQGEVEIALQNAGIEVLRPTPDVGLYVVIVNVAAAGQDSLNCAIYVQSSLLQIVQLSRDATIRTEAQTWPSVSQARFGVVSLAVTKSTIVRTVKDQVKDFAEDYKAANPKTSSKTASQQQPAN
jgi:hypothetical protein